MKNSLLKITFLVALAIGANALAADCSPQTVTDVTSSALDQMLTAVGPQRVSIAVNALRGLRDSCKAEADPGGNYVCHGVALQTFFLYDSSCDAAAMNFAKVSAGDRLGLLSTQIYNIDCHGSTSPMIRVEVLSGESKGKSGYTFSPKSDPNWQNFGSCF